MSQLRVTIARQIPSKVYQSNCLVFVLLECRGNEELCRITVFTETLLDGRAASSSFMPPVRIMNIERSKLELESTSRCGHLSNEHAGGSLNASSSLRDKRS